MRQVRERREKMKSGNKKSTGKRSGEERREVVRKTYLPILFKCMKFQYQKGKEVVPHNGGGSCEGQSDSPARVVDSWRNRGGSLLHITKQQGRWGLC